MIAADWGGGKYSTKFAKVKIVGDEVPFDPSWLIEISDRCILWGANHFANALPPSPCWLVWDKRAASLHSNDFADCELAWFSQKGVARMFRHQWDGMMKASERGVPRDHPTQKPIDLMKWCLGFLPDARTILDPFMGSGTTGVACVRLERGFIGIEIDEAYFDIACRRIADELKRPRLALAPPPKAEQQKLAL